MKSQRMGDILSGVFLSFLGVFVVWAALQIKGAPDMRMHPRTLPLILGWTIGIAGAVLAFRAWRYRGPVRLVAWPDGVGLLRVAVALVSLAVFLFFVEPLGFPLGKRVSIGVERITRPGLFFLDEATSGLDPGTENQLMRMLRQLADQGQTIC